MESAAIKAGDVAEQHVEVEEKGLKKSLGFFSTLVVGMNSTAPAYSLTAVLAGIVVAVGVQAPASLIVSFIPMFLIAASFYYFNRADPDCGTTFAWVTRAFGPYTGWIAGWAVCMTGILVIGSLADVAALYTFSILGLDSLAENVEAITALAVAFIIATTALVIIGTEISARFQIGLAVIQLGGLLLFSIVAIVAVIAGDVNTTPLEIGESQAAPTPADFSLSWFFPWDIPDSTGLIAGLLIGVFIYWGWESALTLNEESEDSSESPGRAGIASTVLLVITYVLVATAVLLYAGPEMFSIADEEGVESGVFDALATPILGEPLDKLVLLAVLTSGLASTQTTILPASRTALSMAVHRAAPKALGNVSPRFFTPTVATVLVAVIAIAWYVPLNLFAQGNLYDSLQALSLLIAFYYGINGLSCVVFYRDTIFKPGVIQPVLFGLIAIGLVLLAVGGTWEALDGSSEAGVWDVGIYGGVAMLVGAMIAMAIGALSFKRLVMMGYAPFVGGVLLFFVLFRSVVDLADPANADSEEVWLGVTPALVMGLGLLIVGVILLVVWRIAAGRNRYFSRKPETFETAVIHTDPLLKD